MPTESKFLSNVVYNQPFDPRDDITVSFLYSSPSIDNGDNLLLEGGEFDQALFELQNSGDFLVFDNSRIWSLVFETENPSFPISAARDSIIFNSSFAIDFSAS